MSTGSPGQARGEDCCPREGGGHSSSRGAHAGQGACRVFRQWDLRKWPKPQRSRQLSLVRKAQGAEARACHQNPNGLRAPLSGDGDVRFLFSGDRMVRVPSLGRFLHTFNSKCAKGHVLGRPARSPTSLLSDAPGTPRSGHRAGRRRPDFTEVSSQAAFKPRWRGQATPSPGPRSSRGCW